MEDIGCGVVGLLLFGKRQYIYLLITYLMYRTVTSLLAKIIFGIPSTGLDGQIKDFRKPLFEVFAMFYGIMKITGLSVLYWTGFKQRT
eukprot:jgi/Galph1/3266/GphlegSOOS_G1909.1